MKAMVGVTLSALDIPLLYYFKEETQVSQKAGAKRAATEILRGAKPKKQKVEPKQEGWPELLSLDIGQLKGIQTVPQLKPSPKPSPIQDIQTMSSSMPKQTHVKVCDIDS